MLVVGRHLVLLELVRSESHVDQQHATIVRITRENGSPDQTLHCLRRFYTVYSMQLLQCNIYRRQQACIAFISFHKQYLLVPMHGKVQLKLNYYTRYL